MFLLIFRSCGQRSSWWSLSEVLSTQYILRSIAWLLQNLLHLLTLEIRLSVLLFESQGQEQTTALRLIINILWTICLIITKFGEWIIIDLQVYVVQVNFGSLETENFPLLGYHNLSVKITNHTRKVHMTRPNCWL